jgi:hypothetical protein
MDDDFGPALFLALRDAFKNLKQRELDRLTRGEAIGAIQLNTKGIAVFMRMPSQSNDDFRNHPEIFNAEVVLTKEVKELFDFAQDGVAAFDRLRAEIVDLKAQLIESHADFTSAMDLASAVMRDSGTDFLAEAIENGDEQVVRLVHTARERILADRVSTLNEHIAELEQSAASHLEELHRINDTVRQLADQKGKLEQGNSNGDTRAA